MAATLSSPCRNRFSKDMRYSAGSLFAKAAIIVSVMCAAAFGAASAEHVERAAQEPGGRSRRLADMSSNGVTGFQPTQAKLCNFSRGQWLSRNKAPYGADCPFLKNVGPVNCIIKPRNRNKNWMNYRFRPKNCDQPWFAFSPLAFLQRMENKVFASVGDSLSFSNLMPSLLCQIYKFSPVKEIPNDGIYAAQTPLTKVYRVEEYNVTLINTWSTFLNEYRQDEETLKQYNGGRDLTDEDSVVNLDGLDANWAAYIGTYDVLILQTQAHWQATKHKWRRFWVNSTGDQVYNESRFIPAFEYGMAAVRNLLDQPEAPVTYFISAPARMDGCTAMKAPYTDAQVGAVRQKNRQFVGWLPAQQRAFAGTRIRLIDVTTSSLYRPDAFVGSGGVNNDCIHWCLPGVPDWWIAMVNYQLLNEPLLAA